MKAIRGVVPPVPCVVRLASRSRIPTTADAKHALLALPSRPTSSPLPKKAMVLRVSSGIDVRGAGCVEWSMLGRTGESRGRS